MSLQRQPERLLWFLNLQSNNVESENKQNRNSSTIETRILQTGNELYDTDNGTTGLWPNGIRHQAQDATIQRTQSG